jgi:transposase
VLSCASAHHWARELCKLGHEVKPMPPQFVKAYVKTNKNELLMLHRAHQRLIQARHRISQSAAGAAR